VTDGRAIYVIRYADRLHKVGITCNPQIRLAQLQADESRPLSVVRVWVPVEAERVERQAHAILKPWKQWGERFEVGGEVACAAVEMAIALIQDAVPPLPFSLAPSQRSDWDAAQCMPVFSNYVGFDDDGNSAVALRRAGAAFIHRSVDAAVKALRPGDVFLHVFGAKIDVVRIYAKGAQIKTITSKEITL